MENNTAAIIIVTILGLLYFVGIGSMIISFICDPKEQNIYKPENSYRYSVASSYRDLVSEEEEASVIIEDAIDTYPPLFDFDMNKE